MKETFIGRLADLVEPCPGRPGHTHAFHVTKVLGRRILATCPPCGKKTEFVKPK